MALSTRRTHHCRSIMVRHVVEIIVVHLHATVGRTRSTKVPGLSLMMEIGIGMMLHRRFLMVLRHHRRFGWPEMGRRSPTELQLGARIVELIGVVVEAQKLIAGVAEESASKAAGSFVGRTFGRIEEGAAP